MMNEKLGATSVLNVLVAFDKFKGALGAERACDLVCEVLQAERPQWKLHPIPFSDGGDGFAELLTRAAGGEMLTVAGQHCLGGSRAESTALYFGRVPAEYIPPAARRIIRADEDDVVMVADMASVDGLHLVASGELDPLGATTLGTGQLLRACAEAGATKIVLGVGGSATNDLGLGALGALGLRFADPQGANIQHPSPRCWPNIHEIYDSAELLPPVYVACDVDNPLLGPQGAATVYGPQKGLSAFECSQLDVLAGLLSQQLCESLGEPLKRREVPGAGAAGGIAFGLMVGVRAKLVSGFELVNQWLGLNASLSVSELVITGEGRFDLSSWSGKGPGSLMKRAASAGKIGCVLAGSVEQQAVAPHRSDRLQFRSISPDELPLSEALRQTPQRLQQAVLEWLQQYS